MSNPQQQPLDYIESYFTAVTERVQWVINAQKDVLHQAAAIIADSIARGGLWHIFGTGHSHMLAEEAFYRAGGLLAVAPILEGSLMLHESARQSSDLERVSGLAEVITAQRQMTSKDVLLIASNSGRNAVPVEMALTANKNGVTTIGITSMEHTARSESRAPSGKRLFEAVDVVIDNGAPYGDAMVHIDDALPAMGPVSTITGAAIINALAVQAAALLRSAGKAVHVWQSANVDAPAEADAARAGYDKMLQHVQQRVRHL